MIATITTQSHKMPSSKEHYLSRNSNAAGAPLPLIPRRSSSGSRLGTACKSPPETPRAMPVKVIVECPSPPERTGESTISAAALEDSDSSSSNTSDSSRPAVSPRVKRVRGVRVPAMCPPEQSTPTPAYLKARNETPKPRQPHIILSSGPAGGRLDSSDQTPRPSIPRPSMYTPGVPLRLVTESLKPRNLSQHMRASTESPEQLIRSAPPGTPGAAQRLVRKKSGQIVKSSLKSSKSGARGGLSVVTLGISSKSEPNTPTHSKAVHFDSHLEHIKLFLAEQKPLAVSRDGSPTEDTSGTDSDFPSFIYGDLDERRPRKALIMQVTNMPRTVNPNADVALEDFVLSPDMASILGRVRVRNIAFAKWLAVRFTFDAWQTTSEVTAKYLESINGDFDRFSFSIRLNDMLPRIEGKALFLALRYNVAGKEMWDNNGGQNYLATFTKAKPPLPEQPLRDADEGASGNNMADLQSKLENVVKVRETATAGPVFLAENSRHPPVDPEAGQMHLFKTSTSLASRYDFEKSLRMPWQPASSPPSQRHNRMHSYPAPSASSTLSAPSSIPWPQKSTPIFTEQTRRVDLGSPRDLDDGAFRPALRVASDLEDTPFPISSRETTIRNHQRGYFDANMFEPTGLRKTPPGTPRMRSLDDLTPLSNPRFYSFPFGDSTRPTLFGLGVTSASATSSSGDSEDSASSAMSPMSSSSPSPLPSPTEDPIKPSFTDGQAPVSPSTNYRQFINK